MSENTPNTTTELQINNWTYTSSGNVPVGFTVPTPTAIVTTDDDFEITTVTLSFAGTAPSGQNDFSLNYSFSVPKSGNMVDLKISSDDTASVTAASKTANSTLHTDGWARSDWIQSPTETETQITGTFETIGGPYDLTVTVMIVRSLSGKVYGVDLTPTIVTRSVENAYEITTATITISGNAPSGNFAFTANNSFNIPGGNWVEITASSDDSAIITVDELSATSTLHASANVTSDWIESPPETIPVSVSFTNGGGPFSLNLTITTKRALVEMFFLTEKLSGKDQLTCNQLATSEQEDFRRERQTARSKFGYGEKVFVKFRLIETNEEVSPSIVFYENSLATKTGEEITLKTVFPVSDINVDTGSIYELLLRFDDNFSIKKCYTIVLPKTEFAVEFSDEEYESIGRPKDFNLYKFYEWKYFRVRLYPFDVSFSGIYIWEIGDFGTLTGIFADRECIPTIESTHMPGNPIKVNDINETADITSLELTESMYEITRNYYLANKDSLISEDVYVNDTPALQTVLGKLIWDCPLRWSLSDPGTDNRPVEQCVTENVVKNQILAFDGIICPRRQEMTLHYTTYSSDASSSNDNPIGADIVKTFGITG